MYEFFDRLVSTALPRIRDFRGLSPRAFDGRGNYSLGLDDQTIFPEIDLDKIKRHQGMDVTIVTTAQSDAEALDLLKLMGMPFAEGNMIWRKLAWIERDKRKRAVVKKYAALRAELKAKKDYAGLAQLPRDASPTRTVNRCKVTGRRHAHLRKFGVSRLTFREMALSGLIPGVTKASW